MESTIITPDWKDLSRVEKEALLRKLKYDWSLRARPDQLEPTDFDWFIWMLLSGRGAGKTRTSSEWMKEKVRATPFTYVSVFGPTFNNCKIVNFEGESGLVSVLPPDEVEFYHRSELMIRMKNGSQIQGFSADNPERIRGTQCHYAVLDELASYDHPQELWDQMIMTLRLGKRPRALVTTTPRPIPLIKKLVARADPSDPERDVVLTRVATFANTALPEAVRKELLHRYGNTYLGRQELYGEVIEDLPGALWQRSAFEEHRRDRHPDFTRIAIGVDPAVTSREDSDETGIIVAGLGPDLHGYVTEDVSGRYAPDKWAKVVCDLYHDLMADVIVCEVNNGGDLCARNIHTIDPHANVHQVRASRGKWTRAEPVASLYGQGRIHHVGTFAKLEDQCCTFLPEDPRSGSPDRMDAMVWTMHELMIERGLGETSYVLPTNSGRLHSDDPFERKFGHQIPLGVQSLGRR